MKRGLLACVLIAVVAFATGGVANASPGVSAQVDSIATDTSQVTTVFQFEVYNCPAGADIVIAEWNASQPDRPEAFAFSGLQPYGVSNGDSVQHLTLITGSASFLAGEQWVGNGTIMCGAVVVPVAGSGQTKSLSGI